VSTVPERASSVCGGNLFAGLPQRHAGELFTPLAAGGRFRLERIVSTGQATPPGEWLDQQEDEWVVLLSGSATLRFAAVPAVQHLLPGDWVYIPSGCRHRVESTAAAQATVWLALHYTPESLETR
jgi:cupin 2 domain-containing protein